MNNEELPSVRLHTTDGKTIECDPTNTELYSFIGRTMFRGREVEADIFDHIFIRTSEADVKPSVGHFIHRVTPMEEEPSETFMQLAEFMLEMDFPLHLNQRRVPDCDKDAYATLEDEVISRAALDIPDDLEGWDGA